MSVREIMMIATQFSFLFKQKTGKKNKWWFRVFFLGRPFGHLCLPSADCFVILSESSPLVMEGLSGTLCTVCILNRNSNPLTLLQLNFQAPKHTLTLKPTRTRTGLSINLPRSWMRPALRLSELLEQVSLTMSHSSQLSPTPLSYITMTAEYLHLEWGHDFPLCILIEIGRAS